MIDNEIDAFLAHHGIKGMKWGVRKDRDSSSNTTSSRSDYKTAVKKAISPESAKQNIRKNEIVFAKKVEPSVNEAEKRSLTPGQKKAIYIGVGVLATAAIVGGIAYSVHKNKGIDQIANAFAEQYLNESKSARHHAWKSMESFIQPGSYDRPEFSLPAGHVFSRFSATTEKTFGKATYAVHSSDDVNRYLGYGFGSMVENGNGLRHVRFSAKSEVRVPNLNTTLDTVREVLESRKGSSLTKEEVISAYARMSGGQWDDDVADNFFESLIKKGYSAIVDEMDAGVIGETPLVVFNHKNMTSKQVVEATMKDVISARKNTKPLNHPKIEGR